MQEPIIIRLSEDTRDVDAILTSITHIHASCIEYDKMEATFLPPLSFPKMFKWWQGQFEQILLGRRHIWVEFQPISSRKAQLASPLEDNASRPFRFDQDPNQEYEMVGTVAMYKPDTETGPFRAEVHKLMVSPNHREKGVARRLMKVLEETGLEEGRTNLMLDTEVGSPAEKVYPRLGYIRVGMVPDYGYSPVKGKMCDEVWFYKDLRKSTL